MSFLVGLGGISVEDDGTDTILSFASAFTSLVFNDGVGTAVSGGLNNLVDNSIAPWPVNRNEITFRFFEIATGNLVETISVKASLVTGSGGSAALASVPEFTNKTATFRGVTGISTLGTAPFITNALYFTVSIDTTDAGTFSPVCGSDTGFVDTDRLTFVESYDLSTAVERGQTTSGGVAVQAELEVATVEGPLSDQITVNNAASVNGTFPFTFLSRNGATGQFSLASASGAGDERGSVKVMSFEGRFNTTLGTQDNIQFSLIPSSSKDEFNSPTVDGTICRGTGTCQISADSQLTNITTLAGDIAKVQEADLVVITESSSGQATTKAGTYLVRHAISPTGAFPYRESRQDTALGSNSGWLPVSFPTLVSFDEVGNTITISDVFPFEGSPATPIGSDPFGGQFSNTGWLYVLTQTPTDGRNTTALSIDYTGITKVVGGYEFALGTSFQDTAGNPIATPATQFWPLLNEGLKCSGMVFLPLNPSADTSLPPNNLVTHEDASTVLGFNALSFGTDNANTISKTSADFVDLGVSPVAIDQIGFAASAVNPSNVFISDVNRTVYDRCLSYMDITGLDENRFPGATFWNALYANAGTQCVAPGVKAVTASAVVGGTNGLRVKAGIFLEPSLPTSVFDLDQSQPHIVDATHSLSLVEVGFRDEVAFGAGGPEVVSFEVRRIRRWHLALNELGTNLSPLRFAYEIRRGTANGYAQGNNQIDTLTALSGTQLGLFNDPN
ncbi:MAG: hypothetical protein AAGM67_03830, partial [Bacteroidota bacterium]